MKQFIFRGLLLLIVITTVITCHSANQKYFGNYFDRKNTEIIEKTVHFI